MSSKLSLSLAAALALSAAGGVARAAPLPTNTGQALSSTDGADESGNPASVDYADRAVPEPSTNDEVDATETGVPASVDYSHRPISGQSATNDAINAAEIGNPESPDYRTGWRIGDATSSGQQASR